MRLFAISAYALWTVSKMCANASYSMRTTLSLLISRASPENGEKDGEIVLLLGEL